VKVLPSTLPDLADALHFGIPSLKNSPAFNKRLEGVFTAVQRFSLDPNVTRGVSRLDDTVKSLDPTLKFVAPTQTVCNYATLFFRNVASLLSEGDSHGTWQRFIIIPTPAGPELGERPVERAGERAHAGEPPPRQRVPEHRGSRPDARVRGGQRELPPQQGRSSGTCPGTRARRRTAK